jgi:hypothetical protein
MTDHPEKKTISGLHDALFGESTLDLKIIEWKKSIHGVNKSGKGDYPIGELRIRIGCKLQRTLSGDILVGENPIESLTNLDFTLQLRGVRKLLLALETEDTSEVEEHATGFLIYHAPILSEIGSVTGWAFFDDDVLWRISSLLIKQPENDVHVQMTAKAAATPKSGLLTYETQPNQPTTYRWSGKEALVLRDVAVVITNPAKAAPEELETDEDKTNEILLSIERAAESINKNLTKMVIFILAILGAILLELWRFR